MIHSHDQRGVVALISIVVISTITLGLALAVSLLGISDLQNSFYNRLDELAETAADTCLEEGIFRLKRNNTFTTTTITIDANTSCTVTLTGSGGTRTITTIGTHRSATVNFTGTLTITETANGDGRWVDVSNLKRG